MPRVEELVWTADERDAPVAEVDEVLDRRDDPWRVVEHHGRAGTCTVRPAEGDRGQAELGEHARAGIVDAQVGEQNPVDAVVGGHPAVHLQLGVEIGDHLQHQRRVAGRQLGLDAGHERREEGIGGQQFGGPGEHETDGVGTLGGERSRRLTRVPAQLSDGLQDPFTRRRRDPRAVVHDERHQPFRHPGMAGDIDDRGPSALPHRPTASRSSSHVPLPTTMSASA